jgi:malonyl-CoA/methylmalonyl-CoA synthetase
MKSENLFCALRAAFPENLREVAIETDSGLHYSWLDLERASAMMANLLDSLDLPAGARVAVHVEKSVEAFCFYLATLRAGLVFVPMNPAYLQGEVTYFIGDAKPSVVVTSTSNLDWVEPIANQAGIAHVFTLDSNRTGSLLEHAVRHSDAHQPANKQAGDLAAILYTSGTTGRSKGAMLSHGNMLSNALVLKSYWGWQRGDVLMHVLPIFHVHGLFVAGHGALLNGSKMLWFSKFDAQRVLERMQDATIFMGVPTLYARLLAEKGLNARATRTMRLFISGSAPLLKSTFDTWTARTGHTILERYGMSETVMLTSNPYASDSRYGGRSERRGGTVGFPLPGVAVRIADERGMPAPVGTIGAIQVKGPNVFSGYWQMPERTKEEFTPDGYFKTGDVGSFDPDGYLTIVGRSKDMFISGGFNVYPTEIEAYANTLPGIAESAVVGMPDADFGEIGAIAVVPQRGVALDPARILAELKSILSNYKIPKRCLVLADLPRNAMGKVQKNSLRDIFASDGTSSEPEVIE